MSWETLSTCCSPVQVCAWTFPTVLVIWKEKVMFWRRWCVTNGSSWKISATFLSLAHKVPWKLTATHLPSASHLSPQAPVLLRSRTSQRMLPSLWMCRLPAPTVLWGAHSFKTYFCWSRPPLSLTVPGRLSLLCNCTSFSCQPPLSGLLLLSLYFPLSSETCSVRVGSFIASHMTGFHAPAWGALSVYCSLTEWINEQNEIDETYMYVLSVYVSLLNTLRSPAPKNRPWFQTEAFTYFEDRAHSPFSSDNQSSTEHFLRALT